MGRGGGGMNQAQRAIADSPETGIAPQSVVVIPSATIEPQPSTVATIARWVVMVPAAILSMNLVQIIMQYMISHASDEEFSLPFAKSAAYTIASFMAGGVGVIVAAYIAPSRKGGVATVFASVLSTLVGVAIAVLWKESDWLSIITRAAYIGGLVAGAWKINATISRAS